MNPEDVHEEILSTLEELCEEEDLHPKLASDLRLLIHVLQEPIDMQLRVDRCRKIIEDLDEKPDLDMYVRTQLWNVSALLEQL